MKKRTFCIGEDKDAYQLRGDQLLCLHYSDRTIPLLSKSKISSFKPSSVTAQTSLCRTCLKATLLVFS